MPTTEHIHLPLYTDEETPDLSTTGHYNHAMEILDANVGELEKKDAELAENIANEREARIAGDSALDAKLAAETKARTDADTALDGKVAEETAAREAADTALGSRIDNAETEISANSADLTGIKGLTYGTGGQVFLENENGSYSSPALVEISHEISDLQDAKVNSIAPLAVDTAPVVHGNGIAIGDHVTAYTNGLGIGRYITVPPASVGLLGNFIAPDAQKSVCIGGNAMVDMANSVAVGASASTTRADCTAIGMHAVARDDNSVALGTESSSGGPYTVSVGNNVSTRRIIHVTDPTGTQDAATKNYVDTAIASVNGGINANTTFGDLASGVTA